MLKEIKELKISKSFEAIPGVKWFGVDIVQEDRNIFHVTLSFEDSANYDTNDG
ncbi:hypothetical protein [Lactovum miscens]|uniref:Uncharacterized protein n=1 Tax=Lactovum miscens TaxID=190387 RepID=A0A841C7C5_9LACT|nr:hypothetical protein [Lactovum miscens]MBB5887638.1 hypothetical protein [Lactovum miscens]